MPLAMQSMEAEFPLLVYTYYLKSVLDLSKGCSSFYTTNWGFTQAVADALCGKNSLNITTFDFTDTLATSKAWMNIYLNNMTYSPENYADLIYITLMSYDQLNTLIYGKNSKMQKYLVKNVLTPVYTLYKDNCTLGAAY